MLLASRQCFDYDYDRDNVGGDSIPVVYYRAGSRRIPFKVDNAMRVDVAALNRCLKLLGFCLLLSTGLSCSNTDRDLIGTWQGQSSKMSAVVFKFEENGTFSFRYDDPNGALHSLTGKYEADFSKSPVPLSLRDIPQLSHPLHTIIQFRGPDSLRIGDFARRWRLRPISFSPASEILLERR